MNKYSKIVGCMQRPIIYPRKSCLSIYLNSFLLSIQDKSGPSSFQQVVKEYRGKLFKNKFLHLGIKNWSRFLKGYWCVSKFKILVKFWKNMNQWDTIQSHWYLFLQNYITWRKFQDWWRDWIHDIIKDYCSHHKIYDTDEEIIRFCNILYFLSVKIV